MSRKVKVSIETVNETKYYTMSYDDYMDFLYKLEDKSYRFIKIPGTNVVLNSTLVVYIYHRDLSEGETIEHKGL